MASHGGRQRMNKQGVVPSLSRGEANSPEEKEEDSTVAVQDPKKVHNVDVQDPEKAHNADV